MSIWVVEVTENTGYKGISVYDSELEMLQAILRSCIEENLKICEVDSIEGEYKFTCEMESGEVLLTIDVYRKELNPRYID